MTEIIAVAINVPLRKCFDYRIDPNKAIPAIGSRVLLPFGRQKKVGIVLAHKDHSSIAADKLKFILDVMDAEAIIPPNLLQLYKWCERYYGHPIGEIVVGTLPKKLRSAAQKKTYTLTTAKQELDQTEIINQAFLSPNPEQQQIIDQFELNRFQVSLLDGITGSGKTEVYLHIIRKIIQMKQQVLLLVPEIGLTPQLQQRFKARFPGAVVTLHSQLSDKQRLLAWEAAYSGSASIIIGTRSAVFTPLPQLGAIIIDEEHDGSFKQQEGFRYHARHVAIMRAKFANIPILLGSATPSIDTLHNTYQGKYRHFQLRQRAGAASLPNIELINIKDQELSHGIAPRLYELMQQQLTQQQQVMIFLNRRGYSQVVYCPYCGWTCQCTQCDANMTLHRKQNLMRCHHCQAQRKIPQSCDNCRHPDLMFLGEGTEKIEEQLVAAFPKHRCIRIDSDTVKHKGKLCAALDKIQQREVDIIIGTQMMAKGHHFPHCSMVAVLNMDQCLLSSNFRHVEYGGQLLLQIAGRAGREQRAGQVYIQTTCVEHPYLQPLQHHNYHAFYQLLMQERQQMKLPPLVAWAYIEVRSKKESDALQLLQHCKHWLEKNIRRNYKCYGPIIAAMQRKAGWHQARLCIEAADKIQLQQIYHQLLHANALPNNTPQLRWYCDVDPIN